MEIFTDNKSKYKLGKLNNIGLDFKEAMSTFGIFE